ncbi:MAG: DUF3857 domain-containing protein [Candidatus Latescibacteria bacterium]|nr:DUF3857 domain-containing protein [Candidatus Latescibacterota bacterium]
MKRAILLSIIVLLIAAPAAAGPLGMSSGRDLDALLARARALPDFAARDAVLLCEARSTTVTPDGDLAVRVHQVVWIATRSGLQSYADLRVPWHAGTSTLAVLKLRTWRDGRWWPDAERISPTAVVETLPYALEHAADYADLRETMLLHDGVELPCLLETEYEIVERGGAQAGADGLWVFARRDHALVSECTLNAPEGIAVRHAGRRGAPAPTVVAADGATTLTWRLEDVPPYGLPALAAPQAGSPSVLWSTWESWQDLGDAQAQGFEDDALPPGELPGDFLLGVALRDTLDARLDRAPDDRAKAHAIVKLLNEGVRPVRVDDRPWRAATRSPARTWETAYGHGRDRAALATALFRAAGLSAGRLYRARGGLPIDPEVPSTAELDGPFVEIAGAGLKAVYDPGTGRLTEAPSAFAGPLWRWLDGSTRPSARVPEAGGANLFVLEVTLEPGEDGGWRGTGFLRTDGLFSAHDRMAGLDADAQDYLASVVASVLEGATLEDANPATLRPESVIYGFDVVLPAGEADASGRLRLAPGSPRDGLLTLLPADVHLHDGTRGSPVLLPGALVQRVRVTLNVGDREVVRLPQDHEIVNQAGRFRLRVEREGARLVVEREVEIAGGESPPSLWPDLRLLLLEEADPVNRAILLR